MDLLQISRIAYKQAQKSGFWEEGGDKVAEKIALIHSEISEALEEHRKGSSLSYVDAISGKPEGVAIELADAIIRIGDLAGYLGIDLDIAVQQKMDYNMSRPYKHGRNF